MTDDYEPSGLGWVREHVGQIVRTGTTDGVTINGLPTVLMTYRGARTGKVRKTPLMRVEHEGRYAAVASKGGEPANPQWYASLLAEPLIGLQDGAVTREYRAREVSGDEKALWWRRAVDAYPDYADYQRKTDRQIPVFVLEPVSGVHLPRPACASPSRRLPSPARQQCLIRALPPRPASPAWPPPQLSGLDAREARHFASLAERLTQLAGMLTALGGALADDTAALAASKRSSTRSATWPPASALRPARRGRRRASGLTTLP